ncbi:MAG TPA: hypothetical protein PLA94_31280, partial [Myxococcota bacterium]|nr:hypothetical protein [Myxococcota bacterium]
LAVAVEPGKPGPVAGVERQFHDLARRLQALVDPREQALAAFPSVQATGADAFSAVGGTTYAWATGTWTYGAGGGAGGSIWLITSAATLGSNSLNASGGYGEATHIRHGGNGGVGRIRVDFETVNGSAYGSAAATTALATAALPDAGYTSDP